MPGFNFNIEVVVIAVLSSKVMLHSNVYVLAYIPSVDTITFSSSLSNEKILSVL